MLKTIEELEASGLQGDELNKFYSEGELTIGELMDFLSRVPKAREYKVLVNDSTVPCAVFGRSESTGTGLCLQLYSKEFWLNIHSGGAK